jgi:hypothetical protein
MKTFKIVPISRTYAEKIKSAMIDSFNNPIIEQLANGLGPCRVSLKPFEKGIDIRLLFKHSPFEIENAYNQPGPVFINKADVEEYSDIHRFPPGIKANKKSFPLTLIGYNNKQMMVLTETVGDKDVDELITNIFNERADVEYLHARNAQACCFICKIERF